MRTRCRRCGNIASTDYPCKQCGATAHTEAAMKRQDAMDDAVGMLIDLIEAFPDGMPGSHLAFSFRNRLPELLPYVSKERQREWDNAPTS